MNKKPEKLLLDELRKLEGFDQFESLEDKANHIGLVNEYKMAIDRLSICESYGISKGSIIKQLPETENIEFCYLVVHENESSDPCNWEKVLFNGRSVTLESGDLVIKR